MVASAEKPTAGLSGLRPETYGRDVGETDEPSKDMEALAQRLSSDPDYKVLRRLRPVSRFKTPDPALKTSVGIIVDVETTGLDGADDRIIELALQRFRFDEAGHIIEVGEPRVWREDPGWPLDPSITRLTGLTDADLAGQAIDEQMACFLLASADVIFAHNAAFDRPHVERRLPPIAGRPWACTCNDLDWRELGFEGKSLSYLVVQCGWFYEAHRAEGDVLATLYLLAHELEPGETVLKTLIHRAQRPTFRLHVIDSPFRTKDTLKARGYLWDGTERYWWREVCEADLEDERTWLAEKIYTGWGEPAISRVDWTTRHAKAARS